MKCDIKISSNPFLDRCSSYEVNIMIYPYYHIIHKIIITGELVIGIPYIRWVRLFWQISALAPEIAADINRHGVVSFDPNTVNTVTDLDHVVVDLEY